MIMETKAYLDSRGNLWGTPGEAINSDAHSMYLAMSTTNGQLRGGRLSKEEIRTLYNKLKEIYG